MKYNLQYNRDRAQLLEDAADLLERSLWIQGSLGVGDAMCAVGALNKTYSGIQMWTEINLPKILGFREDLIRFNDRRSTTKKMVLHLFRMRAAEIRDGK